MLLWWLFAIFLFVIYIFELIFAKQQYWNDLFKVIWWEIAHITTTATNSVNCLVLLTDWHISKEAWPLFIWPVLRVCVCVSVFSGCHLVFIARTRINTTALNDYRSDNNRTHKKWFKNRQKHISHTWNTLTLYRLNVTLRVLYIVWSVTLMLYHFYTYLIVRLIIAVWQ